MRTIQWTKNGMDGIMEIGNGSTLAISMEIATIAVEKHIPTIPAICKERRPNLGCSTLKFEIF
jgi:hypothetical protein